VKRSSIINENKSTKHGGITIKTGNQVVSKNTLKSVKDNVKHKVRGNNFSVSSTSEVVEVHSEERIREIGRMATGNLDTAAGSDLAKALLRVDFSEHYSNLEES
jgi:hypothetical protein